MACLSKWRRGVWCSQHLEIPQVAGGAIDAEVEKTAKKIEDAVLGDDREKRCDPVLPEAALPKDALVALLHKAAARVRH